ncbi:hypothetical protein [Halosimplex pelagicum]|uniref:Uncharacterized protein n=1 Tax=Halosimplex pelagicum TaxID=869886 RepID=A0A7D5PEB9_9EURY|nr:hypothetical protein [Halosimplex pelagicum]QLH81339.1 hypothetical protein HZS54_06730 [Halosimplex pelagicum]
MPKLFQVLHILVTILVFIVGCVAVAFGFSLDISYISYGGVSIIVSAVLYTIYKMDSVVTFPVVGEREKRATDILMLLLISVLAWISQSSPGVPTEFYTLFAFVHLIFILRILFAPSKLVLGQIILFAVTLQQALWNSAPVVGKDPRLHVGLTEFVANTGRIFTDPSIYYRDFPVAHVLGGLLGSLLDIPPRQAFFVAISIPATLGIVAVAATTNRLVTEHSMRASLFSALFLATLPDLVLRISYPIAQTLELAMIAPIILIIASPRRKRGTIIIFVLLGVLTFTHNVSLLILAFILGSLILFHILSKHIPNDWKAIEPSHGPPIVAFLITVISMVVYWDLIGYLRFQVMRALWTLFGMRGASEETASASFGGALFSLQDPVVQLAFGLFFIAAIAGFAGLWVLDQFLDNEVTDVAGVWAPASVLLVGFLGVSITVGGIGRATRLTAAIMLVFAPIAGITLSQLGRRRIGAGAVCLLLISPTALAVYAAENNDRNRLTPPTNRAVDDYPNHLSSSELSALKFAIDDGSKLRAVGYTAGYISSSSLTEHRKIISETANQDNLNMSWLSDCGGLTLYRANHKHFLGVEKPPSVNVIYDSGGGLLLRCPKISG